MKNRIKLIFLSMLAAFGLSNCIDVHQVINVKKDGSGTIEETMFISMPPELAALGGGEDPIQQLLKGDKVKGRAKGMGEGVEFVSSKPIEKDGKKGVKNIFKFSDINKLKLNGDAGMSAMNPDPNAANDVKNPEELYQFKFEKGATSKLTIKTPPMEGVDAGGENVDPAQLAVMGQFMKGMRVRVTVKPDGKITKTNATHSDSDKVTLLDMQMDKLLKDPAKFQEFSKLSKEKDRKKVAAKLKELEIKGETKEEVNIEFK